MPTTTARIYQSTGLKANVAAIAARELGISSDTEQPVIGSSVGGPKLLGTEELIMLTTPSPAALPVLRRSITTIVADTVAAGADITLDIRAGAQVTGYMVRVIVVGPAGRKATVIYGAGITDSVDAGLSSQYIWLGSAWGTANANDAGKVSAFGIGITAGVYIEDISNAKTSGLFITRTGGANPPFPGYTYANVLVMAYSASAVTQVAFQHDSTVPSATNGGAKWRTWNGTTWSGWVDLIDSQRKMFPFTPILTSTVGTIGSYTAMGAYMKIGKAVVINFSFTITNNATGAGAILLSGLPFLIVGAGGSGCARDSGISGHASSITASTGAYSAALYKYDNTYPGATGSVINGSFVYQTD